LKIRLRANHYETVQASDGYSAIVVAQKEQPNLIILDLGLPAADGFTVLERLKDSDPLSNIPVIVPDRPRSPIQRAENAASGGSDFLPEACGQQRATGRDSRAPSPIRGRERPRRRKRGGGMMVRSTGPEILATTRAGKGGPPGTLLVGRSTGLCGRFETFLGTGSWVFGPRSHGCCVVIIENNIKE